ARLEAVAGVAVAARRAVRERAVLAAPGRVAAVGGARVQVVAVEGRAGGATARLARLQAVAEVPIAARRPVRDRGGLAAGDGIAVVRGARIQVVAVRRRARETASALARLGTVAGVAVAARRAVRHRRVHAPGRRVAAV